MPLSPSRLSAVVVVVLLLETATASRADYVNFEAPHVHPIALTPSGARLLAVNTPDATLEVFSVAQDGSLQPQSTIPVGLEPVSVRARTETEAWVVNYLSDTVSIVDLDQGSVVRTIAVGDEPTDVAFAAGKAFVTVSQEDAVKAWTLAALDQAPQQMDVFNLRPHALAVSSDATRVYAVARDSGNQTTVVNGDLIRNLQIWDPLATGRAGILFPRCGSHPTYPPLPPGVVRNPALTDPADGIPKVSVIARWDAATASWRDDAFQDWTTCLRIRLPDHDLFIIDPGDAVTPASLVTQVDHLGTTLFDVSVNPGNGRIYVPNSEARNFVRFEPRLRGHVVDDRVSIVDPSAGNTVSILDLNAHIDRGSDPSTNLMERLASVSQPGMMVWNAAGTTGYLTALGSRKIFRMDGTCTSPECLFGPSRTAPDALTVGEGPTGVALLESANRLYVLNRFSNSIALVDTASFGKIGEVPLHDPSPPTIRNGRHFLYDAILSSAHGDAACSSCHISGDKDALAWDLGNPAGSLVPYHTPGDNVRFVGFHSDGVNPATIEACDPLVPPPPPNPVCSTHAGFDPQKGPMTTQTLRGMVEPMHWRGDRATMNAFNATFVNLMGTADVGPIDGQPAGLSAEDMESFRQFALGMTLPPNPYRAADDSMPNAQVPIPKHPGTGNPTAGLTRFLSAGNDNSISCTKCHTAPSGTNGGKPGGIFPGDPPDAAAALMDGNRPLSRSIHNDLKIPHLRNLYTKAGPFFGTASAPRDNKYGFGTSHDGADADVLSFLTLQGFSGPVQGIQDTAAFMMYFPGDVKPSVGRNVTLPPGTPPTGSATAEALLATLIQVGNLVDANRHCELTVASRIAGRERTWRLEGGIGSGGLFVPDAASEAPVTTTDLRAGTDGPLTFLCATIGSGVRLGSDRDLDTHLNGDDCAPGDPTSFAPVTETGDLSLAGASPATLAWSDQAGATGTGVVYDVASGDLDALRASGSVFATSCLAGGLPIAFYDDPRPDPPAGSAYFYVVRGRNACGAATFGLDGGADALSCAGP
jgi:YVTN family beta-propeller protein